jgi:hypothetical protein
MSIEEFCRVYPAAVGLLTIFFEISWQIPGLPPASFSQPLSRHILLMAMKLPLLALLVGISAQTDASPRATSKFGVCFIEINDSYVLAFLLYDI